MKMSGDCLRRTLLFVGIGLSFLLSQAQDNTELDGEKYRQLLIERLKRSGFTDQEIDSRVSSMERGIKLKNELEREQIGQNPAIYGKQKILASPKRNAPEPDTTNQRKIRDPYNLYFGYDFFTGQADSYTPRTYGPVGSHYPVGPGDEIEIVIWGERELYYTIIIDRKGNIMLPDIGLIPVNGLTLEKLKEKLIQRLTQVYSGIQYGKPEATTYVEVSLAKIRFIEVTIIGEVVKPGIYNLNAITTCFNALNISGGPIGDRGSLRNIQILREGRPAVIFDVYEYLLSGINKGDLRLENGDVIYVPLIGRTIKIRGEVKRPMNYEIKAEDDLKSLVEKAGGFAAYAFQERIQIERIVKNQKKVMDFYFSEQESFAKSRIPLMDGDSVKVFSILDVKPEWLTLHEKSVQLLGSVRRPGKYALKPSMTIKDLIESAGGLMEETYLEKANIYRTHDNFEREIISLNLEDVFRNQKKESNHLLKEFDKVVIYSNRDLRETRTVFIYGQIRNPGEYPFYREMSVKDIIFMAGGLTENAYDKKIEISRVPNHGEELKEVKLFETDLQESERFLLQSDDYVFVRQNPDWHDQKKVAVMGEVKFQGYYALKDRNERISGVIARAGGLKNTAFPQGGVFFRNENNTGQVAVDLVGILKNRGGKKDLVLFKNDSLYIPEAPKTVAIEGEVGFNTSVLYVEGKALDYYIDAAGGYSEAADTKRVKIVYANGRIQSVGGKWFNPKVEIGSRIIVPTISLDKKTDWIQITSLTTSAVGSLVTVLVLLNQFIQNSK